MLREKVLDLNGIDILTAGYDDILLAVHKEIETIRILDRHIAGEQPSVLQNLCRCLRVVVIPGHDAGTPDAELAHFTLLHILPVLIRYPAFPPVARNADRADLMKIVQTQMHAAGAGRFRQSIVGVIKMVREIILPVADQGRWNRLCADVHQPPLIQPVIAEPDVSPVERIQDILRPRNQQPYDGALLVGDSFQDNIRLCPFQKHCSAAGPEGSHPVKLGAGMIQRRDTQKAVILSGAMVHRLHLGRLIQRQMLMENRLREASGSGREIDRPVILIGQRDIRRSTRVIGHQRHVALGKVRAIVTDIEQKASASHTVHIHLQTGNKFRPEEQYADFRQVKTVGDLIGGITEIERNRDRSGLQDAEIDRQPFQTVKHQDRNLVTLPDPPVDQHVRHTVRLLIKGLPGNLTTVRMRHGLLHKVIFLKGKLARILHRRVQVDQRDLISMLARVSLQQFCYRHLLLSSSLYSVRSCSERTLPFCAGCFVILKQIQG